MLTSFVLVCAVMWILVKLNDLGLHGGVCLECGGRGDHRDDCPFREEK